MAKDSKYDHNLIEKAWQKKWRDSGIYTPNIKNSKKPFYNLWMFPYPSAEGLHAGHAFSGTGSDVYGRYMRMSGKDVFQPIGYDSFGMHSENFAIKINEHPKDMLSRTTKHYEEQLKSLGQGYDWTRTVTTSDIEYYRWTQWLFVQMFKAGLAYRKKSNVNWCPSCKTVLADEQVINGVCERCKTEVEDKALEQWFFRITDYAEKLLVNLGKIDWPDKIKIAQRNWIGKKEGIDIEYEIVGRKEKIVCWTSRPDTNFGATFVVLTPEHPLALKLATKENKQKVSRYIEKSKKKSKEERMEEGKEKTGVFTGSLAINNVNGYKMPIWVTDFVLADVGTGAVVGVPGHDLRDFEFAKKYGLEIIRVVVGSEGDKSPIKKVEQVQEEEGKMVNSKFLNGMDIHKATKKMIDFMEEKGYGKRTTSYHLRDWLISRQRYWGPPIPMVYCKKCARQGKGWIGSEEAKKWLEKFKFKSKFKDKIIENWKLSTKGRSATGGEIGNSSDESLVGWYPVDERKLPVELPYYKDYKPKGGGRGPLADHSEFYETKCSSCGGKAKRETDVSDTFVDSSWYFLRYPSVDIETATKLPFDPEVTKKWLPVDLYFGGAEHSVLHLMYARFITQVFNDLGHVEFDEPFPKFYAHGLMIKEGAKMSKSRGNVVNPDVYINKFGADAFRLYLMFMGPMDGFPDFRDTGIEGMRRFIEKVWQLFSISKSQLPISNEKELIRRMHLTIKRVTEDIEKFRYNTAISTIMEYVNVLRTSISNEKDNKKTDHGSRITDHSRKALKTLALLLAPFAPHMAEEVWVNVLGEEFSIHKVSWPKYDSKYIKVDRAEIVVQVNGKLRNTINVKAQNSNVKTEVIKLAKDDEKVKKWLKGKKIKKEIFVPGKLVNFVVP
jgi:leucyl-tRNA synthetase